MTWRPRIDHGRRVAGAKASLPDEFVTLSQITVGSLLSIDYKDNKDLEVNLQYDETGKAFHLVAVRQPFISYNTPAATPAAFTEFVSFGAQGLSGHAVFNEDIPSVPGRLIQVTPTGQEAFWHITGHARFYLSSTNATQCRLMTTMFCFDSNVPVNIRQMSGTGKEITYYNPPTGAIPLPRDSVVPINAVMKLRQVALMCQLAVSEVTLPSPQTQFISQIGLEVTLCGHYIGKEERTDRHELLEYD